MRLVRPMLSSVVGLTAVVLCGLHLSVRLDEVMRSRSLAADRSSSTSRLDERPIPGAFYRVAVGDSPTTLPAAPPGCVWRLALVSHAPCDERTSVSVTRTKTPQPVPTDERQTTSSLPRWRTETRHRVVLPTVRPLGSIPNSPQPLQNPTPTESTESHDPVEFDLAVHDLPADDPRAYVAIRARALSIGGGLRILWDEQAPRTPQTDQLIAAIRRDWTERVRPAISAQFSTEVFGAPVDIVVTPLLGRLRDGQVSLDGMVRTDDLRRDLPRPYSTGRPVIYLRSELRPGNRLTTVLAHEAMHLAVAESRLRHENTSEQELWLSEGLAHVGERIVSPGWSNLDHRLERWSQNPADAPLLLDPRLCPERWRDPGCRGAAYLFTDWATRKHGPGFVEEVSEIPATGIQAVALVLDQPAHELLEEWALACLLVDRPELLADAGVPALTDIPVAWQPRRVRGEGTHEVTGSALLLWELAPDGLWTIAAPANATAVACAVPCR